VSSVAQTPAAAPPAVPADVTPLYVVTYVEAKPVDRDEAASLLKTYRDASRGTAGNLRSGGGGGASSGRDSSSWPRRGRTRRRGTRIWRLPERRNSRRNSTAAQRAGDDRSTNSLSVGRWSFASGAVYGVTHVDVIPPQKDNAIVALKALGEASRSRRQRSLRIVQQTNRPNHFTVFEVWRSRDAFDANGMSAHQREFRDKLAGMAGALYDERLYEILN